MLTKYATEMLYYPDSFPIEARIVDQDGRILVSSWQTATPRVTGPGTIDIEYDTDITYYHKKARPVQPTLEVYRNGFLFATHPYDALIFKGWSVNFYSPNSPRPEAFKDA